MDYTFKELILYTFAEFLDEEKDLKGSDKKVKFFAIKGKPRPITKRDFEKVAGGQRRPIKKSGFVISTDLHGKKFYVPRPVKKGMTVEFDPQKNKFVYRFDLQAYKLRRRIAKRSLKKSAKKRAMKMRRTMKLRKR